VFVSGMMVLEILVSHELVLGELVSTMLELGVIVSTELLLVVGPLQVYSPNKFNEGGVRRFVCMCVWFYEIKV